MRALRASWPTARCEYWTPGSKKETTGEIGVAKRSRWGREEGYDPVGREVSSYGSHHLSVGNERLTLWLAGLVQRNVATRVIVQWRGSMAQARLSTIRAGLPLFASNHRERGGPQLGQLRPTIHSRSYSG